MGVFWTPLFFIVSIFLCVYLSLRDQLFLVLFMIMCLTFVYVTLIEQQNKSSLRPGEIQLDATIESKFKIDGDKMQFVSSYKDEKILVTYQIKTKAEKASFQKVKLGTSFTAVASLEQPSPNRNDFQFNYQTYLKRAGIHYIAKASNIELGSVKHPTFFQRVENLRHAIIQYIDRTFDSEITPYIAALLVGEKGLFDEQIFSQYQKLGVVHLLAISGLHVNLFVSLFYSVLLRFGITRETSRIILLFLIPAYALLAGFNPPVLRAAGMSFLVLLTAKKISTLTAISFTFILFVLLNPYTIFEVGFQLTYSVAFAIILSKRILNAISNKWQLGFYISLISTLASSVVMMFHFYEFSIVGILLNIVYVPLFSAVIVPLVLISFFASIHPVLFFVPNYMLTLVLQFTEWMTQILADFPIKSILSGRPSSLFLWFFIVGLYFIFYLLEKGHTKRALVLVAVYFSVCYWQHSPLNGEVVIIDVSQGDSILIQLPKNAGTFLIDTGGTLPFEKEEWMKKRKEYSIGSSVLVPSLKARGIRQLDKVFVTHADADHMEALDELADEIQIEEICIGAGSSQKAILSKMLMNLPEIPVKELLAGATFQYGENRLEVIYPAQKGEGGNNDSLVIRAELDGLVWLFTGDIEAAAEEALRKQNISADILKIAHHGSKTSTTDAFVKTVKPQIALISSGLNNRFGHPHPETLSTLNKNQVSILRTDENGMITYTFQKGFHFTLEKTVKFD
ncbi:DNA internalization-related competence protein ComEC/Rec2 [Listeria fleischmannii]|uniref:DNA internalization-related competence protein ComEC/Rec2 n=1 Tax=Listeria fleischmannii TaxID=1069827 RepID=A0A841YGA5_9LIST|nr:DNA internalization-related competence protein ComEC/Rec2 [Listeria fleischmannii]MBC1427585.1 DNA internalization-related competence protein ComEC/Rec2 [Listeria fleischmannii]